MPFPNPANYYLPTPDQFEAEIVELNLDDLSHLNYELSNFLDDVLHQLSQPEEIDEFTSTELSDPFDIWVNKLQADELINLIRWVAERLAHLYHKEACAKAA